MIVTGIISAIPNYNKFQHFGKTSSPKDFNDLQGLYKQLESLNKTLNAAKLLRQRKSNISPVTDVSSIKSEASSITKRSTNYDSIIESIDNQIAVIEARIKSLERNKK